jgi:hypothetical protein
VDRTERFRGRLMSGDRIVIDPVQGFLKSSQRSGGVVVEWTGHFECPAEHSEAVISGNRYRLILIDGRSGTVAVRHKVGEPVERPVINFHGTGTVKR